MPPAFWRSAVSRQTCSSRWRLWKAGARRVRCGRPGKTAAGVIVVDAVVSGGRPGAIYRFNAHGAGVPVEISRSSSTHGWGVAEALALGHVFKELPSRLIVYGIEGKNFGPGQEVSQEVEAAIPELVRRIRREIQGWLGQEVLEK